MINPLPKKELREFGFLLAIGFTFLIGWFFPTLAGHSFKTWVLWIALPALALALLSPRMLYYPYKTWMLFGHIIGLINSHIILGLIFLFLLVPIAVIMRIFGHDPLRKKKINLATYREIRNNYKLDLTRIF